MRKETKDDKHAMGGEKEGAGSAKIDSGDAGGEHASSLTSFINVSAAMRASSWRHSASTTEPTASEPLSVPGTPGDADEEITSMRGRLESLAAPEAVAGASLGEEASPVLSLARYQRGWNRQLNVPQN